MLSKDLSLYHRSKLNKLSIWFSGPGGSVSLISDYGRVSPKPRGSGALFKVPSKLELSVLERHHMGIPTRWEGMGGLYGHGPELALDH